MPRDQEQQKTLSPLVVQGADTQGSKRYPKEGKKVNCPRYPQEPLREKLVVAGIPESEHTAELLAARMPDFSEQSFQGMSLDMMAELLLYLIAKGLVTLPIRSDKALLDMPWGSHVCQFYTRKEDLVEILVPYFKQGLEKNDACVWLVGDLTAEEARSALAATVSDLARYLAKGQMQIRHYTDLYTNPDGTVKAADTLRDQFAEMGSTVRAQGYSGLRASGSVSWIDSDDAMSRFMEYEAKVHCAIQDSRMMAVCTYPARAAALRPSRELIHNHGNIFVKRGEWVLDNSRDAKKIEAVFASLAALSGTATLDELECEHIMRVLRESRGSVTIAARTLGLARTTLHARMRKLGISRDFAAQR